MSVQAILNGFGAAPGAAINAASPNYIAVTASMANATWNTVASHEVLTVTGLVRLRIWIECTATLTDTADGADIQFGVEGATDAFIGATGAAGKDGSTIETGELWYDTSPATVMAAPSDAIIDQVINGLDVGYEITGAALTGGALVFHCVWEPLNSTGLVVAGAGSTL